MMKVIYHDDAGNLLEEEVTREDYFEMVSYVMMSNFTPRQKQFLVNCILAGFRNE
jgi:hypothetical protein